MTVAAKPKLLVLELWGVGDLAMATPFLRAASEKFEVTLLAKPSALALQPRFWPGVQVVPFTAPWTVFRGKYRVWQWPWPKLLDLRRRLRAEDFEFGLSARLDPRDHVLMKWLSVKQRLGFPYYGSSLFLTTPLAIPPPLSHRYEFWRRAAGALGLELPLRQELSFPSRHSRRVMVHTGAARPVRVWSLGCYFNLVQKLRQAGYEVQVFCDPDQRAWWLNCGESSVVTPANLGELVDRLDDASVFIGNDSGPGHVAAICGVPTFTIFGPQLPELFVPIHPQAEWIAGEDCVYKPCKDYCRFPTPRCMENISEENVWQRVQAFVQSRVGDPR